jgi:hypothetical protein
MRQTSVYTKDIQQLGEVAALCYRTALPLLETLPRTRESQQKLVKALEPAFASAGFTISTEFLIEEVMLSDQRLLDGWSSSPRQLAWLMLHEQMSDYFVRYAMHRWNPDAFLVHHVPKAAGTSVNHLLNQSRYFVSFPQTSFKIMMQSRGLIGFASQFMQFDRRYRQDRIYIGGHYNLPDTVSTLKMFGRCQGVTLCRPPLEIMSSAVRYIWTRIEGGDAVIAQQYGVAGVDGEQLRGLREALDTPAQVASRVGELLNTIMDSAQFRSEYDDIYVRYFYNHEIDTPDLLLEYLLECGDLFPSLDPRNDGRLTLAALGVEGDLPQSNVSVFPERHLLRAMGGAESFRALALGRMAESMRIFEVLVKLRAAVKPPALAS